MQSPRIEWTILVAPLVAVDYLRNRGEPDGDTATEVIRDVFDTDTAEGRTRFGIALAVAAVAFYRHICKPGMRGLSSR